MERSAPSERTATFEDINMVAYFMLKGRQVIPWVAKTNPIRISFDVIGDVKRDIQAYHQNDLVGIQDYTKCVKAVKDMLYNCKELAKLQANIPLKKED